MKKYMCLLLVLCMMVSVAPLGVNAANYLPAETDKYKPIRDYFDLYEISSNMAGNYVLENDIDLTEALAEGGDLYNSQGWIALGYSSVEENCVEFTGTFDGGGHIITGLSSTGTGTGLFWKNNGIIKNLSISSGVIIGDGQNTGAIADYNNGVIENCHNYASVSATSDYWRYLYAGGIVGRNDKAGVVLKCSNNASINVCSISAANAGGIVGYNAGTVDRVWNTGTVSAISNCETGATAVAGGIVGFMPSANGTPEKLSNAYNAGKVFAETTVATLSTSIAAAGGITGNYDPDGSDRKMSCCYNVGSISASEHATNNVYVGGISGKTTNSVGVVNCYYLNNTEYGIGKSQNNTCKSLSAALMKRQASFAGFDFESVWAMGSGDYPYPILPDHIHKIQHVEKADATCTIDGNVEHWICSECGAVFSDADGKEEIAKDSIVIPAGHKSTSCDVAPTCTESGISGKVVCSVCGEVLEAGKTLPATGHDWSDWKVTKAATETEEGIETRFCSKCNETETHSIEMLPHTHNLTFVEKRNASCTENGSEAYWKCVKCGKLYSDENGEHELTAPVEIQALGHDYKEVVTAPTCTERGYTTHTCTRCRVFYVDNYVAANGHSWSDWKETQPATTEKEGSETRVCSVCNKIDTRPIPKLAPTVSANPFIDVKQGAYYYDPVLWAVNHQPQITNGTAANAFSPDATCTRGQVVTFLWRAKGCPDPKSTNNPFTDVKEGAYYYKAVLWANENDITNGTGATTFSPESPCTRAHVVTFLWRTANKPAAGNSNPFKDVPAGQYYTDAVLWAVNHNPQITNGTGADTFSPNAPCTRGQIVTFLYRYMK